VLVLVAVGLRVRRNEPRVVASVPSETSEAPAAPAAAPADGATSATATPTPTPTPTPADASATSSPVIADGGTEDLRPSHPLTPRHARIYRENNLIGAMEGAMDVRDGRGLRYLLQQYRSEFPEDPNQLQEGYGIIANCLEHPGPETTAAGQQYFDRERGSTLRKFVARYCMGEP
jgi:pyruvate/2-oxoglutarate dehydrogenase complex dihydrolipoamide acyltransferase (E2) component